MHVLFQGRYGYADPLRERDPDAVIAIDRELNDDFAGTGGAARLDGIRRDAVPRRILVVVPADPARYHDLDPLIAALRGTRHEVHVQVDTSRDCSRSTKINRAAQVPVAQACDWLIVIDDDVVVDAGFLDAFVAAAEAGGLMLAQPAHRIHSHASYAVTQRCARSIVRATSFVEIGPVLAMHRSLFAALLPMPETRWGWGADFLWADRAGTAGWRIGIVDATPIEHLRPVAIERAGVAMAEAAAMLDAHGPTTIARVAMLAPGRVSIGW